MAQVWYIGRHGQQRGPFSAKALRRMAATGQLTPADLVWCQGMSAWKPAGEIAGLFTRPASPHREPEAESGAPVPPTLKRRALNASILWIGVPAGALGIVLAVVVAVLLFRRGAEPGVKPLAEANAPADPVVTRGKVVSQQTTFLAFDEATDLRNVTIRQESPVSYQAFGPGKQINPAGRVYFFEIEGGWLFLWGADGRPVEDHVDREFKRAPDPGYPEVIRGVDGNPISWSSRTTSRTESRGYLVADGTVQQFIVAAVEPITDGASRDRARAFLQEVVQRRLSLEQIEATIKLIQTVGGRAPPKVVDWAAGIAGQTEDALIRAHGVGRCDKGFVTALRGQAAVTAYVFSEFQRDEPLIGMLASPGALSRQTSIALGTLLQKQRIKLPRELGAVLHQRARARKTLGGVLGAIEQSDPESYKKALLDLVEKGDPRSQADAAKKLVKTDLPASRLIPLLSRVLDAMPKHEPASQPGAYWRDVREVLRHYEAMQQQAARTNQGRQATVPWEKAPLPMPQRTFHSANEMIGALPVSCRAVAAGSQVERAKLIASVPNVLLGNKLELAGNFLFVTPQHPTTVAFRDRNVQLPAGMRLRLRDVSVEGFPGVKGQPLVAEREGLQWCFETELCDFGPRWRDRLRQFKPDDRIQLTGVIVQATAVVYVREKQCRCRLQLADCVLQP